MKTIALKMPVPVGNVVRHPSEGPLTVTDDEAQRLFEAGVLDGEPQDADDVEDEQHEDDLSDQTVAALGIIVTKEGVPLNGATKKDDIIAAIRAHRAGTGS